MTIRGELHSRGPFSTVIAFLYSFGMVVVACVHFRFIR